MTGQIRLRSYVAGTAIAALAVLTWALPQVRWQTALVAAGAVFVSEAFVSRIREDVDASLTNVIILVLIMVDGPALAAVAALGSVPNFVVRVTQMRTIRITFNVSQYTLAGWFSGIVFVWASTAFDARFVTARYLAAVGLAACVHSLTNHLMVAAAVAFSSTERFLGAFRSILPALILQVPYVGIALLAVVLLNAASPWALLLMAVPTLIARHGLLAMQRLDESYDGLVKGFVKAIEIKDLYTRGHSERVAELSVLVAEELGVPYAERRLTRYAALLHDVGKVGVPLCVINKPGPLDDGEFDAMKRHPTIGAEILHDIDFLAPAIDIVRYHHERLDGRGYPHGVDGDELSDIVRIVTVVDAFDAMTSTRSYRRALTVEAALTELRRCSGAQFDDEKVAALTAVVERVGWQPTVDFASVDQLDGHEIPVGTAQDRFSRDAQSSS